MRGVPKENTASRVAERIDFLEGKLVNVRVTYAESGQLGAELFQAIYLTTVPLGREYFFVFEVSGRKRLVRSASVIEMEESPRAHPDRGESREGD